MKKSAGVLALEALGLPTERCMSLRIDFEVNGLVRITTTYSGDHEGVLRVIELIRTTETQP